MALVPLLVGAAPTREGAVAEPPVQAAESNRASRDQIEGVLSWLASEIEKRLGHLPHFREFEPTRARRSTSLTLRYEHRVRWVRRLDDEQQSDEGPLPVPARVATFPYPDSILLELTVVDPESQYAKRRQWTGAFRLFGWPVESRLEGIAGEELDRIRQVLVDLLDAVDAAPIE